MKKRIRLIFALVMTLVIAFTFAACNLGGNEPSAPDAPNNFTATAGDGKVTLSWTAPDSDGGAEIIRYEVSKDDGDSWETASSPTGHTFTNLTNALEYTFKVRAVNSAGNGSSVSKKAMPLKPGQNKLGGMAPYGKALDNVLELVFKKEISARLVTKEYKNDVLQYTEYRMFDAKSGNIHMWHYLINASSGSRTDESEWKYIKNANGAYTGHEWNKYTSKWDVFPFPFTDEAIEAMMTGYAFAFHLVMAAFDDMAGLTEGSKIIAGMECENYALKLRPAYNFWVDKEYGFCMEYTAFSGDDERGEYVCEKLETSGVTLPAV